MSDLWLSRKGCNYVIKRSPQWSKVHPDVGITIRCDDNNAWVGNFWSDTIRKTQKVTGGILITLMNGGEIFFDGKDYYKKQLQHNCNRSFTDTVQNT